MTEKLRTPRLTLTPLAVEDAVEMIEVLSAPDLYAFTGGEAPSLEQLERRYRVQVEGSSRAGETWQNWIVRLDGAAIGYVQATVVGEEADLGWVIGAPWQGRGYATEASAAMRTWLADQGVTRFFAHIHADHVASNLVAAGLGFRPNGEVDDEGEAIWSSESTAD
jgi:RimJ/RimL family protein N-acetyltransferase